MDNISPIAAIDIGTNSVRYIVGRVSSSGPPVLLARGLSTPRLGEGLSGTGRLSDRAIDRTIRELARIRNELEMTGAREFRSVGTEALRVAENAGIFLRRVKEETGLTVTILTGEEEARLIYAGAVDNLIASPKEKVLADVGGGSTEIITATGKEEPRFVSLPLGCVRLKEHFSPNPEPGRALQERMTEYCRSVLRERYPLPPGETIRDREERSLVGLGGTFTTLAAIHLRLSAYDGERVHGLILSGEEIERIGQRVARRPPEERKKIAGLEPARADIIIPGLIIVRSIMNHLGLDRVTTSDRGILFGILTRFNRESG